ncbi:MAG TPA: SIS domain-containing protein [Candidatus Avimonoglobus intestinipullorum]|uniref:SIS domain-containing protein n=1 Tax=Candidatus Avimonoglobus intestinipullorum TaxID=2840699 RepID=A0A9D1S6W8_9FIRM|nr:SIS domain-containing protein [Candidatus Avimonoglobus intestinipullorum]
MDKMEHLIKRYPALSACREDIKQAEKLLIDTYKHGGKVLVCGNGGSAADSEHIVGELMKGFLLKRPVADARIAEALRGKLQGALRAISLVSQSAILSAYSNDVDPDMVYAQLVYGYANEGDLVIGLSTSGNSKNVVYAQMVAKAVGAKTLSLTGEKESRLSELSDVTIRVPETETYKVQELHLPVYHYLCAAVEKTFFHE